MFCNSFASSFQVWLVILLSVPFMSGVISLFINCSKTSKEDRLKQNFMMSFFFCLSSFFLQGTSCYVFVMIYMTENFLLLKARKYTQHYFSIKFSFRLTKFNNKKITSQVKPAIPYKFLPHPVEFFSLGNFCCFFFNR